MAKNKLVNVKETSPTNVVQEYNSKVNDSIVVDFEKLLIPFSILLSGLMISLSIIFSLRDGVVAKTTTTGTNTDTNVVAEDNTLAPEDGGDGKATVSIDDDPYLGDKSKAKIAIIEFSDYECPFCKRHFEETYPQIKKEYVDNGTAIMVFRDFPLSFHDPIATQEALAAQCVFAQGGNEEYFKFHDALYNTTTSNIGLTEAQLLDLAKKAKVDYTKFKKCYDDKQFADEIAKDLADGSAAGISGTPGFIIGKLEADGTVKDGIILAGAYPYATFKATIDKLLAE